MTTRCEDCDRLFIVATVCPRCAEIRRGDVTVLQQANWALNYELDESSKEIKRLRDSYEEDLAYYRARTVELGKELEIAKDCLEVVSRRNKCLADPRGER